MAKWAFILLATCVALFILYTALRKKEPPAPPPVVEEPVVPAGPRPGIEFHDPAKQKRYEQLFYAALARFAQPGPGEYLWVRRWDGRLAGGKVVSITDASVSLGQGKEIIDMQLTDLSMESREQVFPTEFARGHALREINGETVPPVPLGGVTRFPVTESIVGRAGPGFSYRAVPDIEFIRGQPLQALEEQAGWIRVGSKNGGPTCWVPKWMTMTMDAQESESLIKDVETLKSLGIVAAVSPENNEADIEGAIWRGTDPIVRMALARTLAAYCAVVRGNNLQFVTIRECGTQRKLGKYTQNLGWRDSS